MKKYRSKKVTYVEAEQFFITDMRSGCMEGVAYLEGSMGDEDRYYCETLSGEANVNDGDFIIHNKKDDEYYPCNPKVFHEKYELDEDEDEKEDPLTDFNHVYLMTRVDTQNDKIRRLEDRILKLEIEK